MAIKFKFTASVLHIIFHIFSLYIFGSKYQSQSSAEDGNSSNKKSQQILHFDS